MKILVVGQGGREHAIVWKLSANKQNQIYCAPGNGGISDLAQCVEFTKTEDLIDFALKEKIHLTVVGPEVYLANGIVDEFEKHGLKIFGPNKIAAMIESSKVFAKVLMAKYGIPTAKFEIFDDPNLAHRYVSKVEGPIVVKADGLAAGKGAVVARSKESAHKAIDDIMNRKIFGEAGKRVVIEEFLEGKEVSILAFCDGKTIIPMVSSMDYKKAYDNDLGPNTGGMGSIAPCPFYSEETAKYVYDNILAKTIEALENEGIRYKGILYAGLMLTKVGPKVLEFNCRFGDPETQVILMLLKNDLLEILQATIEGMLNSCSLGWLDEKAVCVVLVSGGYPDFYKTGFEIFGLENVKKDTVIFHAGTKKVNGKVFTNGGRVLNVCAKSQNYEQARKIVYDAIEKIHFENIYYRKDIALNL